MGEIVFDTASTLNGYLADAHHSLGWLFAVEADDDVAAQLSPQHAAVLVEGSSTYEWVLRHEGLLEDPEKWQEFYGAKPTFVFTSRELPIPDGADVRLVSGSVAEALPRIREAADGGDIWVVGGGDLAGQFLDAGALDRICLSLAPALLDGGAPLLPRTVGPDRLRLVDASAHGQFARLIYEVLPPQGDPVNTSLVQTPTPHRLAGMRNLYSYFAAPDDAAAATHLDGTTFPDAELTVDAGVDPVVELLTLTEILTGRDYEGLTEEADAAAVLAESDEQWIVTVGATTATALRDMAPSAVLAAAQRWALTEELEGAAPEDLEEAIRELTHLAHAAQSRGWRLYCWMSL